MSNQAHNKRPLNPPGLNPSRLGAKNPPPQYKDDLDERTWNYGIIVAAVIFSVALMSAVISAVIWFANSDHETANNPQVQSTTGQSPRPVPPGK
jgi:hypothetical protein